MKVSTNRPVFQALPAVQARTSSRVIPAHRDSTHFRGNDKAPAANTSSAPKAGIGQKLFGSPLKNVGWATAWGVAGGAALFGLPLFPFVAMGLAALGGLHLIAATWQFFTRKKGDAAKADSHKTETPPAEEKKEAEQKEKDPSVEKAADSKATNAPQPLPPAPEKTESSSSETVQEEVAVAKEEDTEKPELPKAQEQSTQTPLVESNDTKDDDSKIEKETSKGGTVAA